MLNVCLMNAAAVLFNMFPPASMLKTIALVVSLLVKLVASKALLKLKHASHSGAAL